MNKLLIGAGLFALGCTAAVADTLLEYRTGNDQQPHTVMKIAGGRILVDERSQADDVLFVADGKKMYVINHRKRQYTMLDEESMRRLGGQVSEAMAQMEAQLAQMPEAQREQMKKMMGGVMDMGKKMMEPEIERTGRSGEFSGYSCEFVTVTVPGVTSSELCVTSEDSLDIPASDRQTLVAMQEHFEELSELMSESLGVNIPFNQVGGVPVFVKDQQTPGGRQLHVKVTDIDASELALPGNYRQVELDGMGQ